MKVVYSEDHRAHDGAKELHFGEMVPVFEMPRRMDMILDRLEAVGFGEQIAPEVFPLDEGAAVHAPDYLDFLENGLVGVLGSANSAGAVAGAGGGSRPWIRRRSASWRRVSVSDSWFGPTTRSPMVKAS